MERWLDLVVGEVVSDSSLRLNFKFILLTVFLMSLSKRARSSMIERT